MAEPELHGQNLEEYLEDIERKLLEKALQQNKHNKTTTARALGISFRSLRYRLQKLGLE
jgi:two-component system response regulator PilR (NtrC family)